MTPEPMPIETQSFLNALHQAYDGATLIITPAGIIQSATANAPEILGLSETCLEGLTIDTLHCPALNTLFNTALGSKGAVLTADIAIPKFGRKTRIRAVSALDHIQNVCGVVVLARDTPCEIELDRMKSDFLATVSHELRTPLTSIVGYSRLLSEGGHSIAFDDRQSFLQIIEQQGRVLLELINDLLEMARLESDDIVLTKEVINLELLVTALAQDYKDEAARRSLALITDIQYRESLLECDPVRIRQALECLFENALKNTSEGGSVTLAVSETADGINLSVSDTGIGIAARHHARLFDQFYQVDSGSARCVSGTGLGLAIVKRIVDLHGGQISVASSPGVGSTFCITLPSTDALSKVSSANLAA